MSHSIVLEKTETGFSAYSPNVVGCVATGATREEAEKNMREALEFHMEGLGKEPDLAEWAGTIRLLGLLQLLEFFRHSIRFFRWPKKRK